MTYEEMIDLLQGGGINVDTFDKESEKSLADLYAEIRERDVDLQVIDGLVVRSARTVRIIITVPNEKLQLHEIGRRYKNGTVLREIQEWAVSETRRKSSETVSAESVLDAAIRGLREELNLHVTADDLDRGKYVFLNHLGKHRSTVYRGLWSFVVVEYVLLVLPKLPWPANHKRNIDDNGVEKILEWLPLTHL